MLRNVDDPGEVYILIEFAREPTPTPRRGSSASGVLDRFPTITGRRSWRPRRSVGRPGSDRRAPSLAWLACRRSSRASSTARSPASFVWRDPQCVAFLSINPMHPGHTLVVPRAEVDHWIDLDPELAAHLFQVAQTIGQAQKAALSTRAASA